MQQKKVREVLHQERMVELLGKGLGARMEEW